MIPYTGADASRLTVGGELNKLAANVALGRNFAGIHYRSDYTQSLRFQLEESGVEVIELMPPAVKTDLTADLPEGEGITLITTDELVKQSFASLKSGALEVRPGQAKQLAFMRRLAPDFINGQLWKASKKLVPIALGQAG